MGLGWRWDAVGCRAGQDPFLLFLGFSHPASAAEGQTFQHPLTFCSYVETTEGTNNSAWDTECPPNVQAGTYIYGYYPIVTSRSLLPKASSSSWVSVMCPCSLCFFGWEVREDSVCELAYRLPSCLLKREMIQHQL